MKEIKLTIDGKEVQLTEEQLRVLRFETRNNPFGTSFTVTNHQQHSSTSRSVS